MTYLTAKAHGMDSCFVCQRKVLEFPGEFAFFPDYALNPDREDEQKAIEAEANGYVHAACLARSNWGHFWRKKWERYYGLGSVFQLLGQEDGYGLYRKGNYHEYELLAPEGIRIAIQRTESAAMKPWKGGFLIPIVREFGLRLPAGAAPGETVGNSGSLGSYTPLDLAGIWGVGDTFLHPEIVAKGKFESSRSLKRYLQGKTHSLVITHHIFIPASLAKTLKSHP